MDESTVLILGCEGSGKSVLVRQLKNLKKPLSSEELFDTQPTTGVEVDRIVYKKTKIFLRELGGNIIPVWPMYYKKSIAAVFLVDASDTSRLSESCLELYKILSHTDLLGKPVLLLLNKSDSPCCIPRPILSQVLLLDSLLQGASHRLQILDASAVTQAHVLATLQWLLHVSQLKTAD
mmetsp:Transcript_19726/g.33883  ORF Transcript_19726/g.33883 Transcript_19726/m.33883 type:complete len:178 (+) Transcript_19726:213-746(+)